MKILMLGNSFTFFNDMPQMLAQILGADVTFHACGGADLIDHLNPQHEMGALTQKALVQEKWDYVVLQEMSCGPITEKENFDKSVRELCKQARSAGAVPVLYATWAYKKGSEQMNSFQVGYDEMFRLMYEAYHQKARENNALIADAGRRFYELAEDLDLYNEDGCHPNELGSRIAACAIASAILGEEIVLACEMKQIEKRADMEGLSYYQMMENAGSSAYKLIRAEYPDAKRFVIYIGKGNNGGDGLVVARLAANDGFRVKVIQVEGIPVTQDAKTNFDLAKKLPVEFSDRDEGDAAENTVIVDAIYGTGFHGSLRPEGFDACSRINAGGVPVISLDIPSGVNADTAKAAEGAVRADMTIAFHLKKPAHSSSKAEAFCGRICLADIGIGQK